GGIACCDGRGWRICRKTEVRNVDGNVDKGAALGICRITRKVSGVKAGRLWLSRERGAKGYVAKRIGEGRVGDGSGDGTIVEGERNKLTQGGCLSDGRIDDGSQGDVRTVLNIS